MILPLGEGSGPKSHDGIPDKLIDDALVMADASGGGGKVVVEEADGVIGGELLPNPAETGDVGKEDGGFAAIGRLAEFPGGGIDHIGDNSGIEELAEGFAEFFFGLELIDHDVEGGGEVADFVA